MEEKWSRKVDVTEYIRVLLELVYSVTDEEWLRIFLIRKGS